MPGPEPKPASLEERLLRLEERVAWLEKHVTAQDRAMLEQAEIIERLKAEHRLVRDRLESGGGSGNEEKEAPPPHY